MDLDTKTLLHPVFGNPKPEAHDVSFAEEVKDTVLPGFSAFTKKSALQTYIKLFRNDETNVRFKHPKKSDSDGQTVVHSTEETRKIITTHFDSEDENLGLVLETNVIDPQTISIGEIVIGGVTYSRIGFQDEVENNEGNTVFGGGVVHVIEGSLSDLVSKRDGDNDAITLALRQAHTVLEAVRSRTTTSNYIACDVIQGTDVSGNLISGVTDLTLRTGGMTGAELIAIREMGTSGNKEQVAHVRLDYQASEDPLYEEVILLNHNNLVIHARLA